MRNPNPYDAFAYTNASKNAAGAVIAMWKAGAMIDDIVEVVENALATATGAQYRLEVEEKL